MHGAAEGRDGIGGGGGGLSTEEKEEEEWRIDR